MTLVDDAIEVSAAPTDYVIWRSHLSFLKLV